MKGFVFFRNGKAGMRTFKRKGYMRGRLLLLLLSLCLVFSSVNSIVYAGEYDEEDESYDRYIPPEYYDPIITNSVQGWPWGEAVSSGSAIVMDMDTGTILYSKNALDTYYPASITKIMTCMLALEYGNLDDVITCGDEVYRIEADSSHLGVWSGEQMTLRQALYGLMLQSANDLAMAIAVYVSGSVEAFADLMNQKAAALGCVNTHFVNPHGLHDDYHYTCAEDMARISRAAYEIPAFRTLVSTEEYQIPPTNMVEDTRYFPNHHKMILGEGYYSEYYKEWCTGGKTGFTDEAWNTLVTFGEKNGLRIVCVVMHDTGNEWAYNNTITLMEYCFDYFHHVQVARPVEKSIEELLQYKGDGYVSLPAVLVEAGKKEEPVYDMVTLPVNASASDLTVRHWSSSGDEADYLYHGWRVGSGVVPSILHTEVYYAPPGRFSKDLAEASWMLSRNGNKTGSLIQIDTARSQEKSKRETVTQAFLSRTGEMISSVSSSIVTFVSKNRLTVVLGIAFILLVVLVMIIIILLRLSKEEKIKRRRRQEARMRKQSEEEIDQKTTAEIEAELRAAMQREERYEMMARQKREQELRDERKLHETEEILEEINRKKS